MIERSEQFDLESTLLLYLADELPAADRVLIERRLVDDPHWSAELLKLRQAHAACAAIFKQSDAARRLPTGEAVAIRRVARAMQQWQVDRLTTADAPVAARRRRISWWLYPLAAAAACIAVFLIWSGNQKLPSMLAAGSLPVVEQKAIIDQLTSDFNPEHEIDEPTLVFRDAANRALDERDFFPNPVDERPQ